MGNISTSFGPIMSEFKLNKNISEYIFIKKNCKIKRVAINDIIYISVEERYCTIVTNCEKFMVQISLSKIRDFFKTYSFIQTHRSTIINPTRIIEIILSENSIILEGNHHVTLSDKYKNFLESQIVF